MELKRSGSWGMKLEGTRRYMAPEFKETGLPTEKIDVYVFWGGDFGAAIGVRSWVDKRLKDSYPMDVVERMGRLGLECVKEDPNKRPDVGLVVAQISQLYLESQIQVGRMGGCLLISLFPSHLDDCNLSIFTLRNRISVASYVH